MNVCLHLLYSSSYLFICMNVLFSHRSVSIKQRGAMRRCPFKHLGELRSTAVRTAVAESGLCVNYVKSARRNQSPRWLRCPVFLLSLCDFLAEHFGEPLHVLPAPRHTSVPSLSLIHI